MTRKPLDRPPTAKLRAAVRGLVTDEPPLWRWTTLRVGGPAQWLLQALDEADVAAALAWADAYDISVLSLGGGSNLLLSEEGVRGLVISTRAVRGIRQQGVQVTAACGEPLSALARRMNRAGLSGLEWACGIPGTVGGAVAMNAGAAGADIASVLASVRLCTDEGSLETVPADQLHLGYRTSALRTGTRRGIVVEATLLLHPEDPIRCRERARAVVAKRRATQPRGASAGCIFKNPPTGLPAGALLDRAGCKGLRVGDAVVSDVHANFIINQGTRNAGDVLTLVRRMQARVYGVHDVQLEPEVEIIVP